METRVIRRVCCRLSVGKEGRDKGKRVFFSRTNQNAARVRDNPTTTGGDARTRPPKPLSTNSDLRRFCVLAGGKGGGGGGKGGCGELQ